jgi:hypothetical protein
VNCAAVVACRAPNPQTVPSRRGGNATKGGASSRLMPVDGWGPGRGLLAVEGAPLSESANAFKLSMLRLVQTTSTSARHAGNVAAVRTRCYCMFLALVH